jgi:NADPH-dependent 2,4-dienoyl-CoA reductase/sulfur reductase-like enzyme
MRRYLIVGSGVAGVAAAEAIRRQDPMGDIHVLGEEVHGFYSRPGLAYFLTGELAERQLYPFSEDDFRKLNVRRSRGRAARIDPASHTLALEDGAVLPMTACCFLPGPLRRAAPWGRSARRGEARQPGGRSGDCQAGSAGHAAVCRRWDYRPGAGRRPGRRGVKTHYFLRSDRYWGNVLDEIESKIVERRLQEEGVRIHYHTELGEILAGAAG